MKVFSSQYLEDLINEASQSNRLRAHANIHGSYADQCQKLFNAIQVDSYIRPHRHSLDPKDECLIAVRGLFCLITFTDQGANESVSFFGSEKYSENLSIGCGLELPAGVWHTVVSLVGGSILFEVKSGPFKPGLAKEFAPWAPEEGTRDANDFFEKIRQEVLSSMKRLLDANQRR
jgi:cupin fold WbuC family metalloprotein